MATPTQAQTKTRPTYAVAHNNLIAYLAMQGWAVSSATLKVRHATSPCGKIRLWFKPQAIHYSVWFGHTKDGKPKHDFGTALSLWMDARAFTTDDLAKQIMEEHKYLFADREGTFKL